VCEYLHIIIPYHIIVLKRQNRPKVGTDKPNQKVKMPSVSDDDVRKRLLKVSRFEPATKGVFRLGRWLVYSFWKGIPGLRVGNWKSPATDGWSLQTAVWIKSVIRTMMMAGNHYKQIEMLSVEWYGHEQTQTDRQTDIYRPIHGRRHGKKGRVQKSIIDLV